MQIPVLNGARFVIQHCPWRKLVTQGYCWRYIRNRIKLANKFNNKRIENFTQTYLAQRNRTLKFAKKTDSNKFQMRVVCEEEKRKGDK